MKAMLRAMLPWALCAALVLGGCAPAAESAESGGLASETASSAAAGSSEGPAPEKPMDEESFLKEVLAGRTLEDGAVGFTLPRAIPQENRLDIEISALIPEPEEHSARREDAEDISAVNEAGSWQAGESYRTQLLEGEVPEGTEVSMAVRFVSPDGIVTSWKLARWRYENGAPQVLPDPRNTVVSAETRDGTTVLTYQEDTGSRFQVALALPEGWTVRKPQEADPGAQGFALLELCDKAGNFLGTVFYNEFDFREDLPLDAPNYYMMIYSGLMMGSVVSWDNDFAWVNLTETTGAATCTKSVRMPKEGQSNANPDVEVVYHQAILAHDGSLGRYVAIELEGEPTGEQVRAMAESIRLVAA